MYKNIMVPLDGSLFAEAALPLALRLSRRAGVGLHLVTVVDPLVPIGAPDPGVATDAGRSYLGDVAERIFREAGGPTTTGVPEGPVVEALQAETVAHGADAVVMATHGRGGLSRTWLGSVAMGFLHETDRPLILVRPQAGGDPVSMVHWGFAKLLIPLDGSELAERALSHATEFGELFAASYHLTRILSHPPLWGSSGVADPDETREELLEPAKGSAVEYLESHAESMRERGLSATISVGVDAQPGRGILAVVEKEGCDSIAMATHGRSGLGRALLGSAADKVVRGTRVPILLYRHGPDRD